MANGHGGARPNAGRKRKADKYKAQINKAEKAAAARLVRNIENLEHLADGGYQRVSERYEPAGAIYIDAPLRNEDGTVKLDANGKPIMVKQRAYPDKDADELVLVERRVEIADKDRAANIWLTEFIAGKPVQQVEAEHDVPADSPLRALFEAAATKIYGDEGTE